MVVDEEPVVRAFLCVYLRDCGYLTLSVESAEKAIALLAAKVAVDLVFSDVRMSGESDGYDLARWIAENRPGLPVILTSGDAAKENAANMLCSAEVLSKPYGFDHAVTRIRKRIERPPAMRH